MQERRENDVDLGILANTCILMGWPNRNVTMACLPAFYKEKLSLFPNLLYTNGERKSLDSQ